MKTYLHSCKVKAQPSSNFFKFGVSILDTIMEGTVSQISYLGHGAYLVWFWK